MAAIALELLAAWERIRLVTVQALDSYPEPELFAYRPQPELRSAGEVFQHIADAEAAVVAGVFQGNWQYGQLALTQPKSQKELAAYLHQVHLQTVEQLRSAPSRRLARPLESPWARGRYSGIAWLMAQQEHEAHHRAQIFMYLRLLGRKPPLMYSGWER